MRALKRKIVLLSAAAVAIALAPQAYATGVTGVNTDPLGTPVSPLFLGAGGNVYMTITTGGQIGINTQSPASGVALDVAGTTYLESNVGVGVSPSSTYMLNVNGGANVTGMTYLESNVGIGVIPTGSYALDLGSVGAVHAGAYYHGSDARLKADIKPIDHALNKLLEIHGVTFDWKKSGRPDMGVTAQDVKAVFPNIVSKGPDGMMSVEYDSMVGPMIEAIRELKADNDRLVDQNAKLEAEVAGIKHRLDNTQP